MRKFIALLLSFMLAFGFVSGVNADSTDDITADAAQYIYNTTDSPVVGSIGGEWAVMGLARYGKIAPPEYFQKYLKSARGYVEECAGVLHDKKYTEYSRVILALTSIGADPRDFAGYNLLMPLGDYDKTVLQGVNGPAWALLALDSGNYEIPVNPQAKTQASRDMYINKIISSQLTDGGFSLSGGVSDPDVTGMVLQALAKYQDREDVKKVTDEALKCMSAMQKADGGFESGGEVNIESCTQMIIALCELGISLDDPRFVKNGKTPLDCLLSYYVKGKGFEHIKGGGSDQMASEQGLCCLVAMQRTGNGKNSFFTMNDAVKIKEAEVKDSTDSQSVCNFTDVLQHKNRNAIVALAGKGIINGKSQTEFAPDDTMTRAEFATIVVRGLNLTLTHDNVFSDVSEKDWFFDYVCTAYSNKIVSGTSETTFTPNGTITFEQAAAMIARAAKLCGMNTDMSEDEIRNALSGFTDYKTVSDFAKGSLAFCYKEGILSDEALEIRPKSDITRAEIAQMLYNMLVRANRGDI